MKYFICFSIGLILGLYLQSERVNLYKDKVLEHQQLIKDHEGLKLLFEQMFKLPDHNRNIPKSEIIT